MNDPSEKEKLLKEYFNTPIKAPPHLVTATLQNRDRSPIGVLFGAAALNLIIALLLALILLTGPILLFWKIILLLVFSLFQVIAVALLVYNIVKSPFTFGELVKNPSATTA